MDSALTTQPDDLSAVPGTQVTEGENQVLCVAPGPQREQCGVETCLYTHYKTCLFQKEIIKFGVVQSMIY